MFKKKEPEETQENEAKEAAPAKRGRAKKEKPALVATKLKPKGEGHNSGLIPAALEHVDAILELDAKIKELNKAKRDHRNALKNEFGVLSSTVQYEISMRKKDPDVRVQIESNIADFKTMLGYQPSLFDEKDEEYADPGRKLKPDVISREG